ncbi:MAG TPA: TlyA family RNA methyltransferase [Acidobacteriaceae bacterium]
MASSSQERSKGGTKERKERIDVLVVQRGLAPSRERARALILAGRVLAAEQKVDKPGALIAEETPIRILGEDLRYVSRGGLKLEAALEHWRIVTEGRACLDIGTSTGGFTDCLLQHGAAHVSCVDTGFGQIAMKLRQLAVADPVTGAEPKIRLYERTNARTLAPGSLLPQSSANPPQPALTLLVMDVSFISATLVLPAVLAAAPRSQKRSSSSSRNLKPAANRSAKAASSAIRKLISALSSASHNASSNLEPPKSK